MTRKRAYEGERSRQKSRKCSNVKFSRKYDRFGETIRYLRLEELQMFLDCIEDYREKLIMRLIYALGCRVGEFVRIQLKHINFERSNVYFPKENTKTNERRTSHLPRGLTNETKSMLKKEGRMTKRKERLKNPEQFLFFPCGRPHEHYTENRIRQIFRKHVDRAKFNREYGLDSKGRALHELTIHSLRHSHIMHYIHVYKLPLPIVQRQVGHKTLKATSVYLKPTEEAVAEAYDGVNRKIKRVSRSGNIV